MPAVIPLLVAGAATFVGASATLWFSIATIGVGLYERDKAKREEAKARRAFNDSIQDRLITVRSAVSPRRYVLGTIRTGGTLLYAETVGTDKTSLDSVTALCCNETEPVGYYIGDEFLTPENFPGDKYGSEEQQSIKDQFDVAAHGESSNIEVTLSFIPSGTVDAFYTAASFRGHKLRANVVSVVGTTLTVNGVGINGNARIFAEYTSASGVKLKLQYKSGTADQESENWALVETPQWTADHRLRGVTYIRTLMVWDETIFANGAPPIGAVMRGHAIDGHPFYDPRDASNPSTTDNPAILAGWWMTMPRSRGGCGIPSDWIDWNSIATAANVCDELITVRTLDGTDYEQIRRYRCNTVLSTENPPLDNLQIILSAMAGRRAFTAGKYKIFAGAFRSATLTISDADIVGTKPIKASSAGGDEAPANIVTATFANATKNWQESNPKPVINQTYVDLDGHESPVDIRLQATTDPRLANYLMGVTLESLRPAFAVTLTVGGIGEDIALYDTVQLNISNRPALVGKTFEVVQIADFWNGEFELTLAEIRPQTWALDPDRFTPSSPVTLPDLSYLWNVPPITGLAVELGEPQILPDGNAITQVTLTWDAVTALYIGSGGRIEIRYAEAGGEWIAVAPVPGDSTGTTITASLVEESNYVFQVRLVNSIGAAARQWSQVWVEVEGTELAVGVAGPGIFTWANPVGVSTTSSSITKTAATAAYDAGAHSLQSYTGGCFVSARLGQIGTRRVIGLNGDPAVDSGNLGIDYALATTTANVLQVYESGLLISSHGAVTADTLVTVKYNNADVVYEKDGATIRTTTIGANRRFFLDCSLYETGATLVDVAFGPMGGIGPQGLPGVNAQSVRISATAQAFTYDGSGTASPAGQTITFTAARQNIATAAVWSAVGPDGLPVTLTGSGDTRTLSLANFGARAWARVRVEASGFFDEVTVVRLTQGANSFQIIMSNESHTLAANPDGVVGNPGTANGRMFLYEGTTDRTATAAFSVVSQSGCTGRINTADNTPIAGQPRGYYRLDTITSDDATLTLRVEYGSFTQERVFSVSLSREGQPGDGQNLLPIGDWVVGTQGAQGPGGRWISYESQAGESRIVLGGGGTAPLGPFGTSEALWECAPSGNGGPDGGFEVTAEIDHRRTYRSTVWVRFNQLSGNIFHGCDHYPEGNTTNLAGGVNLNPYFIGGPLSLSGLQANKWYLSVGIIHGSGYTGGYSGIAGVYDPETGRRVLQGTEYKNTVGALQQRHRVYHEGDSSSATRQWMPKPRFEEINGSEPTLDSLLGFQRSTPWIETGACYASTTSFYKVGGNNEWGADSVHSALSYRACHLQFKPGNTSTHFMVGINSDPSTNSFYGSIDFTFYCAAGSLQIYENGVYLGEFGTYSIDTELAITVGGDGFARYYKDRQLLRPPVAAAAVPYGLDSDFHSPGAQVNNVRFGPGIEFESISTGELAPRAATEVYTNKAKSSGNINITSSVADPSAFTGALQRVAFDYTPLVSCLAVLTWTGIVRLEDTSGVGVPTVYFRISCVDLGSGTVIGSEYGALPGVLDGTLEVQFAAQAQFPILAGRAYHFGCVWSKAPDSALHAVSTNSELLQVEIIKV